MWRGEKVMMAPTRSEGRYHYLRASTHVVEPEIRDAIIVGAHFELCPIKYLNLKFEKNNWIWKNKRQINQKKVIKKMGTQLLSI